MVRAGSGKTTAARRKRTRKLTKGFRAGRHNLYRQAICTLLRARDVPARLAAVYAPGLDPMDFHAVVEAWVEGAWRLVDATRLAPRRSMLRIATGRDAADTAFLTLLGGVATFGGMTVTATAAGDLPAPDDTPFPLP